MNEAKFKKYLGVWIAASIVLAIGTFYIGAKHGQAAAKASFASRAGMGGQSGMNRRFGAGANVVSGSVISKDSSSVTVKMRDGSSRIVLYSGSTQVLKSTSGTADDVSVGTNVSVIGSQNSDGSVTAQTIQIRPDGAQFNPQAPKQGA